jgi:hypothetical protein
VEYELGSIYVDKGGVSHADDQFLRWVNIQGSGMLNSPGIRPLKNIHNSLPRGLPAYLVLVTHEKSADSDLNPWEDLVNLSNAEILYWGDSKAHSTKRLDDFAGNAVLRGIFDYLLDGERAAIPPILHFSKPEAGVVKFNGLCVLERLDLAWFYDADRPVRNYHARLRILDCDKVSLAWLHHRAQAETIALLDDHPDCPSVWRRYKSGETIAIDIWRPEIRAKASQLPSEGSDDDVLLQQLANLQPFDFERVVVAIFREIRDVTHHIEGTRKTGDGGFDFFGRFVLQHPLDYVIHFRGEVKRYSRTTAVTPKDVSRLVARLGRQEYGLFVTTSYFTEQAQKEVLSDSYPVHLIPGAELVKMLRSLHIAEGRSIRGAWLQSVLTTGSSGRSAARPAAESEI